MAIQETPELTLHRVHLNTKTLDIEASPWAKKPVTHLAGEISASGVTTPARKLEELHAASDNYEYELTEKRRQLQNYIDTNHQNENQEAIAILQAQIAQYEQRQARFEGAANEIARPTLTNYNVPVQQARRTAHA